jgi:hypothetical protein
MLRISVSSVFVPKIVLYGAFNIQTVMILIKFGICTGWFSILMALVWIWMGFGLLLTFIGEVVRHESMMGVIDKQVDPFNALLEKIQGLAQKRGCTLMEAVDLIQKEGGECLPDWIIEIIKRKDDEKK